MSLFRQQAVAAQTDRLLGDVLLLPRPSHSLIIVFLLCWITAVIYWLTQNTYARKEVVQGWLQPPSGVTRLYASSEGIIKHVLIAEGERVVQNQSLVVINGDLVLASGDRLESLLLDEYAKQQSILTKQLHRSQSMYVQRERDLDQQIEAVEGELALLDAQLITAHKRHALLKEQVDRYRALNQSGHVSTIAMEAKINQELALQSEAQGLQRSQINQKNRIDQLEIERFLLPRKQANNTDVLNGRLSDLAQKMAQVHGQRTRVITATRSGVVHNLLAKVGEKARPSGAPLLSLIPENTPLTVQLVVPVRAAGFISVGQSLDIRYDAFPYQKFGLYRGTVIEVSQSVQMPNEVQDSPIRLQEAVYRVTASLAQPDVKAYGKSFALKSGMTLSADIQLSERSLFQWLLEPIFSLRGRV